MIMTIDLMTNLKMMINNLWVLVVIKRDCPSRGSLFHLNHSQSFTHRTDPPKAVFPSEIDAQSEPTCADELIKNR